MADYNSILAEQRKKYTEEANELYKKRAEANTNMSNTYVADINKIIDTSTKTATDKIQAQADSIPQQYQYGYDINAIQQKINERQVAERMNDLGLTDSGLNRTQQTAINIQRSNADAALTQQKNNAINSLKNQIAEITKNAELSKQQNAAESRYNLAQTNNALYNSLMDEAENKAQAYAANWQAQQASLAKARVDAVNNLQTDLPKFIEKYEEEASNVYLTKGKDALNEYVNRLVDKGYSEELAGRLYNYITGNYQRTVTYRGKEYPLNDDDTFVTGRFIRNKNGTIVGRNW